MKRIPILIASKVFFSFKRLMHLHPFFIRILFIPGLEAARWQIGKLLARYARDKALRQVPAYRHFVSHQQHALAGSPARQEIPVMDKENYVKRYALAQRCLYGEIPSRGVIIDESSGSTGAPTNWVRSKKERRENKRLLKFGLDALLGKEQKFLINAFALGPWATGVNITISFEDDAILKSLGPDVSKIVNTLRSFGTHYKYVIMGYPPFLKSLTDVPEINWQRYNVTYIFGGEGISESMRTYLLAKGIKAVYGSLGASDLELNIGSENDFTINLRRLIAGNPALASRLIRPGSTLPMIFQFNPMDFFIESNAEGELLITLCRDTYLSPKVRYNLHDLGHVMRTPELSAILKEFGIDPGTLGRGSSDLPLLFHYGRSDQSVAYFGCKLTPQHIQEALFSIPELAEEVNAFLLYTEEDKEANKSLEICFELKEGRNSTQLRLQEDAFSLNVIQCLSQQSQDFRESLRMVPKCREPKVRFHRFGEGPFRDSDIRIKNKYIKRAEAA